MGSARNHYDVLGVGQSASLEEIKLAYRRLSRKYHPDLNPKEPHSSEFMRSINESYRILSNRDSRIDYDRSINSDNYRQAHRSNEKSNEEISYLYKWIIGLKVIFTTLLIIIGRIYISAIIGYSILMFGSILIFIFALLVLLVFGINFLNIFSKLGEDYPILIYCMYAIPIIVILPLTVTEGLRESLEYCEKLERKARSRR